MDSWIVGILVTIGIVFGMAVGVVSSEYSVAKRFCSQSHTLLADYEECVANPPWNKK